MVTPKVKSWDVVASLQMKLLPRKGTRAKAKGRPVGPQRTLGRGDSTYTPSPTVILTATQQRFLIAASANHSGAAMTYRRNNLRTILCLRAVLWGRKGV